MRSESFRPVALAAAACLATVVAGAIVRSMTLEQHLSRFVMRDWLDLMVFEAACAVPLFFVYHQVRGAKWLWLLWLIAALDFSWRDLSLVAQSQYSLAAFAVYVAWGVKAIVALMLFLPSSPPSRCKEKGPNKSPEPTVTAVTPRAIDNNFDRKQSNVLHIEARVAPAATVAHL